MSRIDWIKQGVLTAGLMAMLSCGAVAAPDGGAPRPIPQPAPPSTPIDNDLTVDRPVGNLMLKNADQINLLNSLAVVDISMWPVLLKRNHSILNDEFIQVMSNRSQDAMGRAVTSHAQSKKADKAGKAALTAGDRARAAQLKSESETASKASSGYVEISFRYALLADLTATELGKPRVYRYQLAAAYARSEGGAPMALALVGNILVTDPQNVAARMLSGQIREKTGDFYGAMVDYQFVVKKDANNAVAWTAIGKAHLVVSDFPKAKEALRRAVACTNGSTDEARKILHDLENPQQLPPPSDPSMLPGGTPTEAETADSIAVAAEKLLRENRVDDARKGFMRAIQLESTNARAHMGLGDIYFRCSDFMKAIDEYNLASKYSPANAEPLRYMGLACEKVYDTTKAPIYLDRAIECIAGAIRIKTDYAEARADQERLLTKKSNDPAH